MLYEEYRPKTFKAFKRLVQDSKNNMRAVLTAVEGWEMFRDAENIEA